MHAVAARGWGGPLTDFQWPGRSRQIATIVMNATNCDHARLHAPAYMPCAPLSRIWAHESVRFMHAVAARGGGGLAAEFRHPGRFRYIATTLLNATKCDHARLHAPAYMPSAALVGIWAHESVRFRHAVAARGSGVRRPIFSGPANFDKSP
jgi:hypothetical protein